MSHMFWNSLAHTVHHKVHLASYMSWEFHNSYRTPEILYPCFTVLYHTRGDELKLQTTFTSPPLRPLRSHLPCRPGPRLPQSPHHPHERALGSLRQCHRGARALPLAAPGLPLLEEPWHESLPPCHGRMPTAWQSTLCTQLGARVGQYVGTGQWGPLSPGNHRRSRRWWERVRVK